MRKWWNSKTMHALTIILSCLLCALLFNCNANAVLVQGGGSGEGSSTSSSKDIRDKVDKFYSWKIIQACRDGYSDNEHKGLGVDSMGKRLDKYNQNRSVSYADANGTHDCNGEAIDSAISKMGGNEKIGELFRKKAGKKSGDECKDFNSASCYNLLSNVDVKDVLNSLLSKYKYGDGDMSTPEWFVIWNDAFDKCRNSDFETSPGDASPQQTWAFSKGSTLKPGSDGKLKLEKVYAQKISGADSKKSMPWAESSGDGYYCGKIFDEVAKDFPAYVNEYNKYIDKNGSNSNTPPSATDPNNSGNTQNGGQDGENDQCEAGLLGFGWVLCPGSNIITTFASWLLGFISGLLNWTMIADSSETLLPIWQKFVSIANIVFAIAFIVMIYSMATSTGLSNYDIKKILPRLIIVAIMVNVSFYICAALVDLSNVVGQGVFSLMTSLTSTSDQTAAEQGAASFTGIFDGAANIVGQAASAGVALIATVVAILCFGGTVGIGFIIIICCVLFRQIVLTILVLISPIAFALYMLPNTEKWFKKWFDMFGRMLLVFPMFMTVWGGSILIANITAITKGSASIQNFIIGCICAFAPAVAIIPLFKASGGLMAMATGAIAGSKVAQGAKKAVNGFSRNNAVTRAAARKVGAISAGYAARQNKPTGLRAIMAGRIADKAYGLGQSRDVEAQKLDKDALDRANSRIGNMTPSEKSLVAMTGIDSNGKEVDQWTRRAAISAVGKDLTVDQTQELLLSTEAKAQELEQAGQHRAAAQLRNAAADAIKDSGNSMITNGTLNSFRNGEWAKYNTESKRKAAYSAAVANKLSDLSMKQQAELSGSQWKHADNLALEAIQENTTGEAGQLWSEAQAGWSAASKDVSGRAAGVMNNPDLSSGLGKTSYDYNRQMASAGGHSSASASSSGQVTTQQSQSGQAGRAASNAAQGSTQSTSSTEPSSSGQQTIIMPDTPEYYRAMNNFPEQLPKGRNTIVFPNSDNKFGGK